MSYPPNTFAPQGNPFISPPGGRVTPAAQLDENFQATAPKITSENYPDGSSVARLISAIATGNGAAVDTLANVAALTGRANLNAFSGDAVVALTDPRWWGDAFTVADSFEGARDFLQETYDGGTIYIPNGVFTKDRSVTFNNALGRINLLGAGIPATVISHTSNDACFMWVGTDAQNEAYNGAYNMVINGIGQDASRAISTNLCAFMGFGNLLLQGWGGTFDAVDTDHCKVINVTERFNIRGRYLRKSSSPTASSTQPNNWLFLSCHSGSCSHYAGRYAGGSNIDIIGGSTEHCGGIGAGGFGHHYEEPGYEGGMAGIVTGHNFEDNNGIADILFSFTNTNLVRTANLNISANSFGRTGTADVTVNSIRVNISTAAGIGRMNSQGNSFCSLGSYTPSGSRPRIAYTGDAADADNFSSVNDIFEDSVERPAMVDQGNFNSIEARYSTTVTCNNGTETALPVDTVVRNNAFGSSPFSGGGVVCRRAGWHDIEIAAPITTPPTPTAGDKTICVYKNSVKIDDDTQYGIRDILGCNTIAFLAVGDVITFSAINSSGANFTVAGADMRARILRRP